MAIKIFEISEGDDQKEEEILKESSLLSLFDSHSSFVSFKGLTKDIKPIASSKINNIQYGIVMELMESSLEEEIKKREKTQNFYIFSEILKFLEQTYEGFIFMETKQIAHRDIKPANILIDQHRNYKISDLGVSKVVHGLTGSLAGTLNYLSFELMTHYLKNEESFQCNYINSDVFSYGLTLLRMLTLENVAGINMKEGEEKKTQLLLKIAKIYPENSQEIVELLKKMLKNDPNERKCFCFNHKLARNLYENQLGLYQEWKIFFNSFDEDGDGLIDSSDMIELCRNFDKKFQEKSLLKVLILCEISIKLKFFRFSLKRKNFRSNSLNFGRKPLG